MREYARMRKWTTILLVCMLFTALPAVAGAACNHSQTKVSFFLKNTKVSSSDEFGHTFSTATVAQETTCRSCNQLVSGRTLKTLNNITESHEYYNGKCVTCGYAWKCGHKNVAEMSAGYTGASFTSVDKYKHKSTGGTFYFIKQCQDCGGQVGNRYSYGNVPQTEPHDFANGVCRTCSYKNTCKHTKTTTDFVYHLIYNPRIMDSFGHVFEAFVTKETICSECKEVLSETSPTTSEFHSAEHYINSYGFCPLCGYKPGDQSSTFSKDLYCLTIVEDTSALDNAILIEGAKVVFDSKTLTTDANGQVFTDASGVKEIKITASGYREKIINCSLSGGSGRLIFLEKQKNDGKPYLVQMDGYKVGKSDVMDLRNYAIHFQENNSSILNVTVKANWNGHGAGQIIVYQGTDAQTASVTQTLKESTINFIYPGTKFQPDKDIYVQLIAKDGTISDPIKLEVYIDRATKINPSTANNALKEGQGSIDWLGTINIQKPNHIIFNEFMDIGLSIVSDVIPVEITQEDNPDGGKTWKVLIGVLSGKEVDNIKYMKGKEKNLKGETAWEELIGEIKKVKTAGNMGMYWDGVKKKYNKLWHPTRIRQSKELKVDINGYAQFNEDINGKFHCADSGCIVYVSSNWVNGQTIYLPSGFPVYYEVKIGYDIKSTAALALDQAGDGTKLQLNNSNIVITFPKASVEAGLGVREVIQGGIKLGAGMNIKLQNSATKGTLTASGSAKFKVLFVVDYEYPIKDLSLDLWDNIETKRAALMGRALLADEEPTMILVSRAYLEDESAWNPDMIGPRRRSAESAKITTLQEGVMSDAMPQIQRVGDKLVMIFLRDKAERAIGNHTQLVYSVYDRGVWSEPQAVWESETADFYFDTIVVDDQLYVAWQKSDTQANTTDPQMLLDHVVSNSEIALAVWNDSAERFEDQHYLTDNSVIDMMPALSENGKSVSVSWVVNDQNDITGMTGINAIYKADLSSEDMAIQNVCNVESFVAEVCAGGDAVAYITVKSDESSDVCCVSGGVNTVVKVNTAAAGLAYEDGMFIWQEDGAIYGYTPGEDDAQIIAPAEGRNVSSSYQYIDNGNNPIIVWHEMENDQQVIKAIAKENGVWSLPITLMDDFQDSISFFDAVMYEDQYAIILNMANYAGDKLESTALKFALVEQPKDVELKEVYLQNPDWENQKQDINLYLTNNGVTTISNVDVVISDEENTYINKSVEVNLAPGETICVTEQLDISRIDSVRQAVVRVQTRGDQDETNQSKLITLGKVELAFIMDAYESNDNVVFMITATNRSMTDANAFVTMYEDGDENAVLERKYLDVIDNGSNAQCMFVVDKSAIDFEDGLKTLFFRIASKEEEWNDTNNVLLYTIKNQTSVECKEHDFQIQGFEWAENLQSCMAVFKCVACEYEEQVPCVITSEVDTEKEPKKIVYTASVEFMGETYTDTLTIEIPASALPNTGDESKLGLWLLLACAACCGLVALSKVIGKKTGT